MDNEPALSINHDIFFDNNQYRAILIGNNNRKELKLSNYHDNCHLS